MLRYSHSLLKSIFSLFTAASSYLFPVLLGVVSIYFFYFVWFSFDAGITHDDILNTAGAVRTPWKDIFANNLFFFWHTDIFRPLPAIVLKLWFQFAPFDVFPLRVVCVMTLFANTLLAGIVARRITSSDVCGALAALLYAFHRQWATLYFSSGFIYDIFCAFFYLLALNFYLRDGWRNRLIAALLYVCALNSKEVAVSFPVTIFLYELLIKPPPLTFRRFIWPGVYGALTVPYIFIRVLGSHGISHAGGYAIQPSLKLYFAQLGRFLQILTGTQASPEAVVWLIAVIILAVILFLRLRIALWGILSFAIGTLPIAFIPSRGLDAVYVPLACLAIAIAAIVMYPVRHKPVAALIVFFVCLVLLARGHRVPLNATHFREEDAQIRQVKTALERVYAQVRTQSTLAVDQDAFRQDLWSTVFLSHLIYRNTLPIFLLNKMSSNDRDNMRRTADYLLNWNGQDWDVTKNNTASSP